MGEGRAGYLGIATALLLAAAAAAGAPPPPDRTTPWLVVDLDEEVLPSGRSFPGDFARFGAGVFFTATDPANGREPWITDGSASGTRRLADVCPGPCDSDAVSAALPAGRDLFLFTAHGALWRTDGTSEGTFRLTSGVEVRPAPGIGGLGDKGLYFFRAESAAAQELWVTDGTRRGTLRLASFQYVEAEGRGRKLGGRLLFAAATAEAGFELWVTDGMSDGTRLLVDLMPGPEGASIGGLEVLDGLLLFMGRSPGHGRELFRSDGTAAGTAMVADLTPGPASTQFETDLEISGGQALFLAMPEGGQRGLYVSDGTAVGTRRLELAATPVDRDLEVAPGGRAVILAVDAVHGEEPWATDGVSTWLLADICPGPCSSHARVWAPLPGGDLLLTAEDEQHGRELWRTDWSPAGTALVTDLCPGPCDFRGLLRGFTGHGAFFLRRDAQGRDQLWVSNGTTAGTRQLTAFESQGISGASWPALAVDDHLVIALDDGIHGVEPWRTDGTVPGTVLIRDIVGPVAASGDPRDSTTWAGRTYFVATGPSGLDGLWVTDGTAEGTELLAEVPREQFFQQQQMGRLTVSGEFLYFMAQTGAYPKLWRSDGTPGGTFALAELGPGDVESLVPWKGGVALLGHVGLWVSDGSQQGTRRVGPLRGWSQTQGLVPLGDHVFFTGYLPAADGFPIAQGLWRSDGSEAGTQQVVAFDDPTPLVGLGDGLAFVADIEGTGAALWLSDGSLAGTRKVEMPAGDWGRPRDLLVGDNRLFFSTGLFSSAAYWSTGTDGLGVSQLLAPGEARVLEGVGAETGAFLLVHQDLTGRELWWTDGTPAGTQLLADAWPGPSAALPENWLGHPWFPPFDPSLVGDVLYYGASNGASGLELWRSDGTREGTYALVDLVPGLFSSDPRHVAQLGDLLLFGARHPVAGRELWALDLSTVSAPLLSPDVPDFRFDVRITNQLGEEVVGQAEPCIAETLCVSGAVAGRSEAFLRVVGPKPNGYLWPTLVKFSTSQVEVWAEQVSTGEERYYRLEAASPGSSELPGRFDRLGFLPGAEWKRTALAASAPPVPPGEPLSSAAFPDFRFRVAITNQLGEAQPVRKEALCVAETLCVSGALPGRSEVFLRVVGPKPNGHLWPTLVRFTTSQVEVWVEQVSTGEMQYYLLEGATPDSDLIPGLFDRQGFLP
ncbi:MAG TPA: hypothetical protein VMT16_01580 [Thermoanaerobaculia bacterium]|nr:hypothetical protein [Thermoanaerobaculia bacterium]